MNHTKNAKQPSVLANTIFLSFGAAIALGFARFNYALLLPAMREDLAWTYAQAGSMNTANALGYLVGALAAAPATHRFGLVRSFWVSLTLISLSLCATGLVDQFLLLLIFRLITGICAAITFVTGATLASHLASQGQSGLTLGLYISGVGLGIFLAGLGLPQLLAINITAWRIVWVLMGICSLIAMFFAKRAALAVPIPAPAHLKNTTQYFSIHLLPTMIAYFLFGLGYITYMTFIIAYLHSGGLAAWVLSTFWLILGASAFTAAFIWRKLLDTARGGQALALILAVLVIGAALPLMSTSLVVIFLSALFFGSTFVSVVSATTNIIRKSLPSDAWANAIALFTVAFSIGQTLGPLISGVLADRTNTLVGGFSLSAMTLFIAMLFALLQRDSQSDLSSVTSSK